MHWGSENHNQRQIMTIQIKSGIKRKILRITLHFFNVNIYFTKKNIYIFFLCLYEHFHSQTYNTQ